MRGLAVVVIFAALNKVVWSAESDCSDNNPYIKRIKAQWALDGRTPSNIIRTGVNRSPGHLRYVTPEYRPDIEQIRCIATYWNNTDDLYTAGSLISKGFKINSAKDDVAGLQIAEQLGQIFQNATNGQQIVRTYINTDEEEVACFYVCDPTTALDPPQAACRVHKGYSKEPLRKAVQDMEAILGVRLSVKLSKECS